MNVMTTSYPAIHTASVIGAGAGGTTLARDSAFGHIGYDRNQSSIGMDKKVSTVSPSPPTSSFLVGRKAWAKAAIPGRV